MKRLTLIPLPFLFLALSLSACSDKNREQLFEPEAPPPTGNIIVQMALTGSSNQGTDQCTVTLDGQYCGRVGPGGSVTVQGVRTGLHTVQLVQIPKDCAATDGTSKAVRVEPAQTSKVAFSLRCGDQSSRKRKH